MIIGYLSSLLGFLPHSANPKTPNAFAIIVMWKCRWEGRSVITTREKGGQRNNQKEFT
jgi:hypothetical protein